MGEYRWFADRVLALFVLFLLILDCFSSSELAELPHHYY
eukprot:COSAG03_NODE_652_length_6449_cov_3.581732_5_plen_39_part_00